MYEDEPGKMGEVRKKSTGERYPRVGPTPCVYCPKQPLTVPEIQRRPSTAAELSPKNWQAYEHYLRCKATGRFPDDWIVARNASAIRRAEDSVEQHRRLELALIGSANATLKSFGV